MGLVRTENQDAVFLPPEEQGPVPGLFVLADGMGGVAGGRVASELAVSTIPKVFAAESRENGLERGLTAAISAAAEAIFQKSQENPDFRGMGTTVVAIALEPGRAVVANVGDSRCYLWRNGELTPVTHDHSVVMEMVDQGQITQEQARQHPMRNVLTRVVGNQPVVEVDLFSVELLPGDQLLLCSDGLHGPVGEELINAVIGADNDPQGKTRILVEEANRAGGPDNISAILVTIKDPGELAKESGKPSLLQLPVSKRALALGLAALFAFGLLGFAIFFIPPKKEQNGHTLVIHGKVDAKELKQALPAGPEKNIKPQAGEPLTPEQGKLSEVSESKEPPNSSSENITEKESLKQPPDGLTEPEPAEKEPPAQEKQIISDSKKPLENPPESKLEPDKTPLTTPSKGESIAENLERVSFVQPKPQADRFWEKHIWAKKGSPRYWRQIGAYANTANLKKDLILVKTKLTDQKQAKLVWTIAPAAGKIPMLYRLLLGNNTKKGLEKNLLSLGRKGVKPLNPPDLLAAGSRYSFALAKVKDLNQAKPASFPELNMVFLAGKKASQAQVRSITDIIKSGYSGGLLIMDHGAGKKKTRALAGLAADVLGHERVFLYKSRRRFSRQASQLLIPRKKVRDFCVFVPSALADISALPLTRRASLIMIKGGN